MSGPHTTPLTDEQVRILRAIAEGRMVTNASGRYVIEGEPRPDRKSRERLRSRGLIDHYYTVERGFHWLITDKGKAILGVSMSSDLTCVDCKATLTPSGYCVMCGKYNLLAGRFVLTHGDGDPYYVTSWDSWEECEVAFPIERDFSLYDQETGRKWLPGARYEWEAART